MQKVIYILIISAICASCKKDKSNAGKNVELYLLKSYQMVTNKCQIDSAASIIQDAATISNEDILAYSPNTYEFELSNAAIENIKTFKDKTPFAITVDRKIIYYGFFKPGISSSSCDHSITMDISYTSKNKILLKLGYPGVLPGITIEDQRNNPTLIASLSSQGKLK